MVDRITAFCFPATGCTVTILLRLQQPLAAAQSVRSWPGHAFMMPNKIVPEKLLFGEVKGLLPPPPSPEPSFNNLA